MIMVLWVSFYANNSILGDPVPNSSSHEDPSGEDRRRRSMNLIDFLTSVRRICDDTFDPKYEHVTVDDVIELDKIYGRHISLADGLRNPELVCPRTKVDPPYA